MKNKLTYAELEVEFDRYYNYANKLKRQNDFLIKSLEDIRDKRISINIDVAYYIASDALKKLEESE